jgi:hypothetical protein
LAAPEPEEAAPEPEEAEPEPEEAAPEPEEAAPEPEEAAPEPEVIRDPPRLPPELPPLTLPGLAALSEVLQQEAEEKEFARERPEDLPWSEPKVIIPAPPAPIEVAVAPHGTPEILSPRTPMRRDRAESHSWDRAWGTQPLSHQIARSGLLVLGGMVLAWWVLG